MANLFNQNIRGTNNYKGILNLGSSIGTALPTTGNPMVYITDGAGANLPIQVAQDKLRFDVNVGIGVDPSASYGLHVQSSNGTVLANRYHFAADRYLDASGVTFPTATNYTFAMGGVNQLIINNTNVVANNSIGFGTAGTPPSIGSYLTSGYSSNGEYMRLYSGHNAQYALANYQFNVADRVFNNASILSGAVASIIDIPNHTFTISNSNATTLATNYRGISLAYTINNTVSGVTGMASGLRIDASITNANGMLNRGFYYGLSGAGAGTNTINPAINQSGTIGPIGIILENNRTATLGVQSYAPSIRLVSRVFAGSSLVDFWEIAPTGGTGGTTFLNFYNSGQNLMRIDPSYGLTVGTSSFGGAIESSIFNARPINPNFVPISVRAAASHVADLTQWQNSASTVLTRIFASGAIGIVSLADSAAPNSSLYFSTTASRLVWKDAGGVVNNLY